MSNFKKNTLKKIIIIFLVIIYGCSTKNIVESNKKNHIITPKIVKTANQNLPYPYVHINGFKDYEINLSNLFRDKNNYFAKELRFNATYSAFYTKKVMYEKFGLWSKEVRIKKEKHPVLIWENIKLFNDNNLYTVFTKGFENTKGSGNQVKENNFHKQVKGSNHGIYASVIVLDSTGGDCLSDNNQVLKKLIIEYFSNGIKNLTSNNEFYDIYWKSVKRKKVKN